MTRLESADVICYRFYDVADGINLKTCRELLERASTETRALRLQRPGAEYIQVSSPPLGVELGRRTLSLPGGPREASVAARIFVHGAISVVMRIAVEPGTTLEGLVPFADQLYDSEVIDAAAKEELARLRTLLEPAMEAPHLWDKDEEYTVILARKLEGEPTAQQLLSDPVLPRLLLGEAEEQRLSTQETREVLDYQYSYTERDLVVVEWNAAFVYEPSGSEDVCDLLELANAQLLELRYYDDVLDRELERMYDAIEAKHGASILYSPYRRLLRELMLTVIELSEFIERIENALKIVGDVYLARVYEGAVRQLRVPRWTEQVTRKHRLLQQTYGLLKGEVDTDRSLTLEVMVVLLIVLESLIALFQVSAH
jgi:hypothetical protein